MEIKIIFEKDEDGIYIVTCPSLPGCVSQGKTEKEAIKNIREAIKLHIKCLARRWFADIKTNHKSIKEADEYSYYLAVLRKNIQKQGGFKIGKNKNEVLRKLKEVRQTTMKENYENHFGY
ncbi:type II toxin-antitoxin system HicB family antitoxin [Candidatus Desantisbacteria bacterium]|nr:type II toxin-antitoxin system HicB family antitoxin [Candidatus Desantisbacteria bacterium]